MWSNQQTTSKSTQKAKEGMSKTHTPSMQANIKYEPRPEGRDLVKNKRSKTTDEESSTSPAVKMLKKIHEKGQEADELDHKYKEEMITIARAKFKMQEKIMQHKLEMSKKNFQLQRQVVEATALQSETTLMFTKVEDLHEPLRSWVLAKQKQIIVREGIRPLQSSEDTNRPSE
jgi:hypothetical protein